MRFGILKKFLIAFLILSLLPLIILSFYARSQLVQIGHKAVESSRNALMENAKSLLEARARSIAHQVELLLQTNVNDLRTLATLPPEAALYLNFSRSHKRQIWIRTGTPENPGQKKYPTPLYREISYADAKGTERIHVDADGISGTERDLSKPFQGPFGKEDYFSKVRALFLENNDTAAGDAVYVSHLLGTHIRSAEQLQGAPDVESAIGGATYDGIIRFAAPVIREGAFKGVVSLALDHQHLMEYTQHVLPLGTDEVVFPSYASGNYAFLFDDEGWIITHPKFWDIRGHDRDTGRLVDPLSPDYNAESMKAGRVPFNLVHVPFIHSNYRQIAQNVLAGRSGVTTTSSVGGVPRIMAHAPIRFDLGEFRKTGYFGGVTLGAQAEVFYQSVDETPSAIRNMLQHSVRHFIGIILMAGCLVCLIAIVLARSFTRPILLLSEKVREVSRGNFDVPVHIRSHDELEILGRNFEEMRNKLRQGQENLMHFLEKLEISKKEAVREKEFIESIFSNIMSGLMVIDRSGTVCAMNQRAEKILGLPPQIGHQLDTVLAPYPSLLEQMRRAVEQADMSTSELILEFPDSHKKHLEMVVSCFPSNPPFVRERISSDRILPADSDEKRDEQFQQTILLVFRDITQRKKMERHLRRSDRLVSLGTLAAGVAHEIRNPLTGISLLLDDLHDRMSSSKEDRVLIQRALEEIEKLERIITELLDFASEPGSQFATKDISKVIDSAVFLVKKQCKQQHVRLIRDTEKTLPRLRLDPEKIRQVFLNILLNALNAMPAGGEILIRAGLRQRLPEFPGGPCAEISISDTGPGISPDDIDYIFDPFFTRNPKGFGLGLSISHTIIEEHEGRILAESNPGSGACFRIFLPVTGGDFGNVECGI